MGHRRNKSVNARSSDVDFNYSNMIEAASVYISAPIAIMPHKKPSDRRLH